MIEIPNLKGKELFQFLTEKETTLIAQKKFELKRGDPFLYTGTVETDKGRAVKANAPISESKTELDVVSIINTTYWRDSHKDVHIDGIWKKSLSETRQLYLLEEHVMSFKTIISDEVKSYTKKIAWRTLGVDFDGYTEALVFESKIAKDRNTYMFDQYRLRRVKNHSVGMRYVTIDLAINDEDYPAHKSLWDKHIEKIANQEETLEEGYFWAVTQAKVVEGSAVPIGSNTITPTQSVKHIQPPAGTGKRAVAKDTRILEALNNLSKKL